jgi:DNA modification methylase
VTDRPEVQLLSGDCVQVMCELPANSVDAIVTDPPYDLTAVSRGGSSRQFVNNPYGRTRVGTDRGGFMGKTWDATGVAFNVETWSEAFRVLKPGAHLLAFGGTRTYHRMTCAIEDAGFEIRDSIIWLYGSGFPKSLDLSKAFDRAAGAGHESDNGATVTAAATNEARRWQGWGTGLKPAHETIVLARKPLSERSVDRNVLEHGTGALNIDGCRIHSPGSDRRDYTVRRLNPGAAVNAGRGWRQDRGYRGETTPGRWPANLVLSHTPECRLVGTKRVAAITGTRSGSWKHGGQYGGGWRGAPVEVLGERIGFASADGTETVEAWDCATGCAVAQLDSQSGRSRSNRGGPRAAAQPGTAFRLTRTGTEYDDFGGASRFFYVTKPSTKERNLGLEDRRTSADAPKGTARVNDHPTVKPVMLLRYLCRLVTPPGGIVMDPFMGSGSTGVAAVLEGFSFMGMELDKHYLSIASKRIRPALAQLRRQGKAGEGLKVA